jgi:hypothetical protein
MSEQDRLRAKLAHEYATAGAPAQAEQMYRVDKGSRMAKLDDLLTASTRQAYIDAAHADLLNAFLGKQTERINTVQAAIAERHAKHEDENETVQRQAREDIKKYSSSGGVR